MLEQRKRKAFRIFLFHLRWRRSRTFKPAPAKMFPAPQNWLWDYCLPEAGYRSPPGPPTRRVAGWPAGSGAAHPHPTQIVRLCAIIIRWGQKQGRGGKVRSGSGAASTTTSSTDYKVMCNNLSEQGRLFKLCSTSCVATFAALRLRVWDIPHRLCFNYIGFSPILKGFNMGQEILVETARIEKMWRNVGCREIPPCFDSSPPYF